MQRDARRPPLWARAIGRGTPLPQLAKSLMSADLPESAGRPRLPSGAGIDASVQPVPTEASPKAVPVPSVRPYIQPVQGEKDWLLTAAIVLATCT